MDELGKTVAEDSLLNSSVPSVLADGEDNIVLEQQTKRIADWVVNHANRCGMEHRDIVPSLVLDGLHDDYMTLCKGSEGGLLIVHDHWGTGKSHGLQGGARRKSDMQPRRFLTINITEACPADDWYRFVKESVGVSKNMKVEPRMVARMIVAALKGVPLFGSFDENPQKLPSTANKCRISMDDKVLIQKKKTNLPILVLDECNFTDFVDADWPPGKDYTIKELRLNWRCI